MAVRAGNLGRRVPPDWKHVEHYPYAVERVERVEKTLKLPLWHWSHDQGRERSCVGHGSSMERSITNTAQNLLLRVVRGGRRYDPIFLWNEAKKVDEWPDTNPGDDQGTSVRAAYDVLRDKGPWRIPYGGIKLGDAGLPVVSRRIGTGPDSADGISANRWATSADQIRTAIASGLPVTIGINWYSAFDSPESFGREYWIAADLQLGSLRGGHCVCLYGASDRRQGFKLKNSWGRDYPLVWLPYSVMDKLLQEDGEAALVTDR